MKDRLVTPGYCFILAANFLLRLLAIDTRIAILSIRSIQCRKLHYRHHSFLLYGSCLMHPSVLRIFSGQFCPQTVVSVSLFHLHDHVCRIHHCRVTHFIYLFRIIHGVSFGMVTVGGNTVVIDIMPSSKTRRRSRYYGLSTT